MPFSEAEITIKVKHSIYQGQLIQGSEACFTKNVNNIPKEEFKSEPGIGSWKFSCFALACVQEDSFHLIQNLKINFFSRDLNFTCN